MTRPRPTGVAPGTALVLALALALAPIALVVVPMPGVAGTVTPAPMRQGTDVQVRSWRADVPGDTGASTALLGWDGEPKTAYLLTLDGFSLPANATIWSATLTLRDVTTANTAATGARPCTQTVVEAAILEAPFSPATVTWATLPPAKDPARTACTATEIVLDVAEQFTNLTRFARPFHGWLVRAVDSVGPANFTVATFDSTTTASRPTFRITYETHPPVIQALAVQSPTPVGAGVAVDPEGTLRLNGSASDPKGAPRNAHVELKNGALVVARGSGPVGRDGVFAIEALFERFVADGVTLVGEAWVEDWDGNPSERREIRNIVVDTAPPVIRSVRAFGAELTSATPLNVTPARVDVDAEDTSCPVLGPACVNLTARWNGADAAVATLGATGSGASWNVTVPASLPGEHTLTLVARDATGRVAQLQRIVQVRDTVPPEILDLAVEGSLAKPREQETGGTVLFDVFVQDRGVVTAATAVVRGPRGNVSLPMLETSPGVWGVAHTVDAAGPHDIDVEIVDGGGNRVARTFTAAFVGLDAAAPRIQGAPAGGPIRPLAPILVQVTDPNLDPATVDVVVTRDGTALSDAQVERALGPGAASLRVLAPIGATGARVEILVRAADALGRSNAMTLGFVLDASPPAASLAFTHVAGAYVGAASLILANVTDTGSGLERATLTATAPGKPPAVLALDAKAPLRVSALPVYSGTGPINLTLRAVDRAGNAAEATARIVVDADAPTVTAALEGRRLVVHATDAGAGVAEATAVVSGRGVTRLLDLSRAAGDAWIAQLDNVSKGDRLRVWVRVVDGVGLDASWGADDAPIEMVVPNTPPAPRIVEPEDRRRIAPGGTLTVSWAIVDPDNEPVTFRASLVHAVLGPVRTLAEAGSTVEVSFDGLAAGEYRIVLSASDTETERTHERTVLVGGPGDWVEAAPHAGTVRPGDLLDVRVRTLAAASGAVLVAERGGEPARAVELAAGPEGWWSGAFTSDETGRWDLRVVLTYPGGDVGRVGLASVDVSDARSASDWLGMATIALVVVGVAALVVVAVLRRRDAAR